MAFNHFPVGMHDALLPLSVMPVTHSVPMARDHLSQSAHGRPSPRTALDRLASGAGRAARITHTEHLPPRAGAMQCGRTGIRPEVIDAIRAAGIDHPWAHQARAAEHALDGESVVVATGTASGKSLAYLAPVLSALLEDGRRSARDGRGATALYLAPTKALAADQRRAVKALAAPLGNAVRPAVYDGDTPVEEREWVRQYAKYVLTNPDMLHRGILPAHARWASFLRGLRYVVIDECHTYRGVFGSHVAQVLRRLRRVCARYGSAPVFLLASATVGRPRQAAGRLTGLPVAEVTEDASPRGGLAFALWEPPLTELPGENGAPVRRTATAETAELLTDLVLQGVRTVAFVRSRRGAELVALIAQERLAEIDSALPARVAAYRGGYLPEERRALERDLHSGGLLGLAATTALELGVDISGLDAVLLAGFPGTRASLWQQAGPGRTLRAGGAGRPGRPRRPPGHVPRPPPRGDVRAARRVHRARPRQPLRPGPAPVRGRRRTSAHRGRPRAVRPRGRHLGAAAGEARAAAPPDRRLVLDAPRARRRPHRHPRGGRHPRPSGRGRHRAAARHRGRLGRAHHRPRRRRPPAPGPHLPGAAAWTWRTPSPWSNAPTRSYTTMARDTTDIRVLATDTEEPWGEARVRFGSVEVTHQVVSYLRRRVMTGEILGESKLDLPPRTLRTRAVWWTVTDDQLDAAGIHPEELPGALHAAEHASIGLLPLFATCDRWDIGGVSIPLHADTGLPTVFVYDGHPGGAGFAERAFRTARDWLAATREAIASCECDFGCPSCVQSPKCGNGNDPLDKAAALRLLTCLLTAADAAPPASEPSSPPEPQQRL